jgi:hypothetical protein
MYFLNRLLTLGNLLQTQLDFRLLSLQPHVAGEVDQMVRVELFDLRVSQLEFHSQTLYQHHALLRRLVDQCLLFY